MENYIINSSTLLLISSDSGTMIYEKYQNFFVDEKCSIIMRNSCLAFGSSFVGRMDYTRYMLGIKYKCPIMIKKGIVFFPTTSYRDNNVAWVNYDGIKKYESTPDGNSRILLVNDIEVELNISTKVIFNQILKSSRLKPFACKRS